MVLQRQFYVHVCLQHVRDLGLWGGGGGESVSKLFDTSVKDKKAVNFWQEKMLVKKKLMS